jgi:hypothetical protein
LIVLAAYAIAWALTEEESKQQCEDDSQAGRRTG